jgi:hypothetical protein
MEELQLQDLKNMEAAELVIWTGLQVGAGNVPAVEVKQKAKPAKHEVAIVPSDPASGNESNSPIADSRKGLSKV